MIHDQAITTPASAQEEGGISTQLIEQVVTRFYEAVRSDDLLGPVFASKIVDWSPHLQRMFAFWSSVMLASGRYHGQPMQMHAHLPIDARHFDRWLALFEATVVELCRPEIANLFMERARRIAVSLEMGRADANDVLLGKGQRFIDPSISVISPARH